MNKNTLEVFGYVRVSTENQLENYSIEEQTMRIRSYCQAKGWHLIKIYTDGGYSGGNINRPALQQMLTDMKRGTVDAIIVYKLDRLSRSQKDTLTLIEDHMLSAGVDFISINENFDTSSPFGRAMIGILSVFAQLEKDQITERFTMGRIGRSKAGYYHGGPNAPRGYQYVDGALIVDEFKASQVKEIFRLFLDGKSINRIARQMEQKYGGRWNAAGVRVILLNSTYIGKVKFAGVEYDGRHQPLISKEDFETAQKLLFSPARDAKKNSAQKNPFRAETLLSGLILCSRCGARYSGCHGYYKCYSRAKGNPRYIKDPNCKNDNWIISELDSLTISSIRELLDNNDLLDAAIENARPSLEDSANEIEITTHLKEIEAQINRLLDLYQIGSIPTEILSSRIQTLDQEKTALTTLLENKEDSFEERKQAFLENIQNFRDHFDDSDLDTQRLLIRSIIESISVDGRNISIQWRI